MKTTKHTKHTPAPWKIGRIGTPGGLRPSIYGPAGEQVADLSADLLPEDEQDANARLIAKAPELLTALVDTLDALHNETHGQDDTPWIQSVKDRARAIIAQATGEE